ncbi:MAG: hypothetical protein JRI23_06825 [Deltaproteobacteria bacterium]|nr:hypothetical protein [Deltaproteobacteria bacterium]MBW2531300.1 hypothetical protein [Deltaproteobacteria bacterium]
MGHLNRTSNGGRLAPLALLGALAACGGAPPPAPETAPTRAARSTDSPATPALAGPPAVPARVIAPIEAPQEDTLTARRGDEALLLVRRQAAWYALPFRVGGQPADQEQGPASYLAVGEAPTGELRAGLAAVGDGYLAVWASPRAGQSEIRALVLSADGRPRGRARTLARAVEPIRWVEVLAHEGRALLLWELDRQGTRELQVTPWREEGPTPVPVVAASGFLAWHATATRDGAVVVTVQTTGSSAGTPLGRVALREVAADGTLGALVSVSDSPTAQPDAQVAAVGSRYVVAWTDTRPLLLPSSAPDDGDPHVHVASVTRSTGQATSPRRPLPPVGPQALVALLGQPELGSVLLAWEPQLHRRAADRRIHLSRLDAEGNPSGKQTLLSFQASADAPHFAAAADGLVTVTLTQAAVEARAADPPAIDRAAVVPTYVRLDDSLELTASEPIRVAAYGEPGIPRLVRSLSCVGDRCSALAVGGDPPVLATVDLIPRPSPWLPAAQPLPGTPRPAATSLGTVTSADTRLAEVTAARLANEATLVAWVTDVQEPMGRRSSTKPQREASLGFRFVSAEGLAGNARVLSERAISVGGVAAAAAVPSDDDSAAAVLAWAAPAGGYPQVFVTKLDADGKKLTQRAVSRASRHRPAAPGLPNQVADVDIASDGRSGYLLAWVDTRHGNAEIYAARLDARLQRKGAAQRITQAPGASTEVRIAVGPTQSRLIWSDAREQPTEGAADVYTASISTATAEKLGDEQRLARTESHSRTPGIAPTSAGYLAWWIEQPEAIGSGAGSGVRVLRLDQGGSPLGRAGWIAPAERRVTSAHFRCLGNRCRGAVASVRDGLLQLDAVSLPTDGPPTASPAPARTPVALLADGSAQDCSLAAADPDLGALAFIAPRTGGGGRARYLRLTW